MDTLESADGDSNPRLQNIKSTEVDSMYQESAEADLGFPDGDLSLRRWMI